MNTQKDYFAFISYKHEDEKWAKWLQNELEDYHLPTKIAKANPNLPKEIRPIFRDTTELKSGKLKQQIEEALNTSKFLIVICSPRAAQSVWVNREIETFIQKKGVERIIPFIVEGTAFAKNQEEECFPPVLRNLSEEQEILGANVQEVGRESAMIKAIAQMLGVNFSSLWNRYERAKKRKLIMWAITGALITLGAISAATIFAKQKADLESSYHIINVQKDSIQAQKNSLDATNAVLEAKNDSLQDALNLINSQKNVIECSNKQLRTSRDSIASQKNLLEIKNRDLITANEQIKNENWRMMENQSRAVAALAINLSNEGDSYTAQMIASEVLPNNLISPDRPYIPEAEAALRKAVMYDNYIINDDKQEILAMHHFGKYIQVIMNDGTVKSWDTKTKEIIENSKLQDLPKTLKMDNFSYSPNGDYIYSLHYTLVNPKELFGKRKYYIDIWNSKTLKKVKSNAIIKNDSYQNGICISPDGMNYIFTDSTNIYNCSVPNNTKDSIFHKHTNYVSYFHSGQLFATGSKNGYIKLWLGTSNDSILSWKAHKYGVQSIDISPDNYHIVSCGRDDLHIVLFKKEQGEQNYDDSIKIWNSLSGKLEKTIICRAQKVRFSPDGNYIIAVNNDSIKILDIETKNNMMTLVDYTNPFNYSYDFSNSISFSDDGRYMAYYCRDKRIRVVDFNQFIMDSDREGTDIVTINAGDDKGPTIQGVYLNPDETKCHLALGGYLYRIVKNEHSKEWVLDSLSLGECHLDGINYLSYSPNKSVYVTGGDHGFLKIWDSNSDTLIWKTNSSVSKIKSINCMTFCPNSQLLATVGDSKRIVLWTIYNNEKNIEPFWSWDAHNDRINHIDWKDNKIISCSNDSTIKIWDANNYNLLKEIEKQPSEIICCKFSPDGKKIAAWLLNGTIKVWDSNYNLINSFEASDKIVYYQTHFYFSPDGMSIIAPSRKNINVWDIDTGVLLYTIKHQDRVTSANYIANGTKILSSAGNKLKEFNYIPLHKLKKDVDSRFNKRKLTPEEKRTYYLE